jgi:hypothetical protein
MPAVASAPPDRSTRRKQQFVALAIVLWVASLISHGHPGGEGDAAHYLIIAHSLAFDGDLDLSNDYEAGTKLVFEGALKPELHARPSGLALRPVHDIGLPLLAAPIFRVTYEAAEGLVAVLPPEFMRRSRMTPSIVLRHLISLEMSLAAAALGLLLFRFCVRLHGERAGLSAAIVALLCISPPLMPLSFAFFTELPSALAAFAIFLAINRQRPSLAAAVAIGFAAAFLLLLHVRNVGLSLALVALAAHRWRAEGPRVLAALMAGAALGFAVRTGFTYMMWGTWISTPIAYTGGVSDGLSLTGLAETVTRLGGLLFDREQGLLPFAPLYLLVPAGWLTLYRERRGLALMFLFLVTCYLLPVLTPAVNPHGWRGGWSPAARFLVPIAPFLAVMVWHAFLRIRPIGALWLVAACQLALNFWFWSSPTLMWEDGDGVSKLSDALAAAIGPLARIWPAISDPVAASVTATLVGLAVWSALSASLIYRSSRVSRLPG